MKAGRSRDKTKKPNNKQQGILSDHTRIGKRFIPPFIHKLGGIQEVKWVDIQLPELLWLALLNHRHGPKHGADLAIAIARVASDTLAPDKKIWFGPISAYYNIKGDFQQKAVMTLSRQGHLDHLQLALGALVALYPECPLAFLFGGEVPPGERSEHLSELKIIIADLFDKTTRASVLMQANALYIAFITEMLKVSKSTSLSNFPAVADYPDTEESIRVGSAVRATINGFFGRCNDNSSSWPGYFWNRGIEIDECVIGLERKI